jgi:uncharacterized membrane protein
MNKYNKRTAVEKRAAKKAAVLKSEKKSKSALRTMLVLAVLVAGGLVFYLLQGETEFTPKAADPTKPEITATELTFPQDAFDDGQARFYQYPADNGINVRFFVLKSSDGVVRAAFDACDVCWRAGQGYYQEGDIMVCRNCSRRFASVKINEVKGGCNPAPLNRMVVDGRVVLQVTDILEGRQYFDLGRES